MTPFISFYSPKNMTVQAHFYISVGMSWNCHIHTTCETKKKKSSFSKNKMDSEYTDNS